MVRVGVEDEFSQSGLITSAGDELMEHFGFAAEDLVVAVQDCIAKKEQLGARGAMR
jgi:transketolase C-terminal domain/subunit